MHRDSFFATSHAGAYLLFFGALAFFVVTWAALQASLGLHLTAMGSQFVAILGSAIIYRALMKDSAASWPALNRLGMGWGALGSLIVACVGVALTANVSTALLVEVVPALREVAEQYKELVDRLILDATGWQKAVALVSVSVVAPICEEALFRGTILQEQRKSEAFATAIVVNGLLFSCFHLNPVGFVALWLVGAFFAHLTLVSGVLWVPILAHAIYNFFNSTVLPAVAPDFGESAEGYGAGEMGLVLLVLMALTGAFWWLTTHLLARRAGG